MDDRVPTEAEAAATSLSGGLEGLKVYNDAIVVTGEGVPATGRS